MHMTFLLLSLPSILSEMNSNLRILQDFIFQLNSNFISNSNLNPSGLLPRPYMSSVAPPPRPSMPILPQNQNLAATMSSTMSLVPLFQSTPFKLNPVSVVRGKDLTIGERIMLKVDM
jgi:hypothetical protein